ncbi:MAG: hypothetical protein CVU22_26010 [Betaproteobacteria bacterium HGW-Betaproteobacteria-16]|nr:MAG: hypothetical protein CVU22_26010 [Betaproteobacteria bacterium HGW-Betaproteobacteria-16]
MSKGPHAPPFHGSLPPEGADPAWGGPAPDRSSPHPPPKGLLTPTLRRWRGSLPPEGADPAWGGPAPDRAAPTLRLCGRLAPELRRLRGSHPVSSCGGDGHAVETFRCLPGPFHSLHTHFCTGVAGSKVSGWREAA